MTNILVEYTFMVLVGLGFAALLLYFPLKNLFARGEIKEAYLLPPGKEFYLLLASPITAPHAISIFKAPHFQAERTFWQLNDTKELTFEPLEGSKRLVPVVQEKPRTFGADSIRTVNTQNSYLNPIALHLRLKTTHLLIEHFKYSYR